jgi:hypothetical protein
MALVAEDEATNQPIPGSKTARCLILHQPITTRERVMCCEALGQFGGVLVHTRPSFACCSPPTTALLALLATD